MLRVSSGFQTLENNKTTRPQAEWFQMFSRVWKPDETLALVFEIVHTLFQTCKELLRFAYSRLRRALSFRYYSKHTSQEKKIILKVSFCENQSQFPTTLQKPNPISDQDGQNLYPISD